MLKISSIFYSWDLIQSALIGVTVKFVSLIKRHIKQIKIIFITSGFHSCCLHLFVPFLAEYWSNHTLNTYVNNKIEYTYVI